MMDIKRTTFASWGEFDKYCKLKDLEGKGYATDVDSAKGKWAVEELSGNQPQPLVTIITPVKNGIDYIRECLTSTVSQNYPYIEHLLVDGVSTDGTLELIKEYQEAYPTRIRYISEPDRGSGEGWVKGIRLSQGSILGELGADDTLEPNAIKTVVDWFNQHPEASFVFGGCNYINKEGVVTKKAITVEFDINKAINDMCSIPATSAFYKREVVEKVDPSVMVNDQGEIEFWIRVGKKFKIHRIEPVLSNFRVFSDKPRDKDYLYNFAQKNYTVGRRHGAGRFSPNARRYYLACATRPFQKIVDPLFNNMSTGGNNGLFVKATNPFYPAIRWVYKILVGGKQ